MTLISTLRHLRKINSRIALNTSRPIAQYQITDDWTLQAVLGGNSFKEAWDFIRALSDRSPFSVGLKDGIAQEIEDMEFRTRPGQVPSSALAWATLLNSATVSFDAHPDWSRGWVEMSYRTLDEAGNLLETDGRVRNASQPAHADEHLDWLKLLGLLAAVPTAMQVWGEKEDRFPRLRFLPRVEKDLTALEGSGVPFLQAVASLEALAKDAGAWRADSPWPEFSTKASPEADQRQKLCLVHDGATGKEELFDWHTRFTGGVPGRVHFRVDSANRVIVVAYIGGKLTRKISG